MKRLFTAIVSLIFCVGPAMAQKGTAEKPDFYPQGYTLDTWTGEVTAFDSDRRTLTLVHGSGKKASTFVATIPDAPYEWVNDIRRFRVVDFPYDREAKSQVFMYVGAPGGSFVPFDHQVFPQQKRPNPPAENVMGDLSQFMGRVITVYYTERDRTVSGQKEKYNDVWRIRILPVKK